MPVNPKETARIMISLPRSIHQKLEALAEKEDRSVSYVAKNLIMKALDSRK